MGAIESDPRLSDITVKAPLHSSMKGIEEHASRGEVLIAHSLMSTQTDRVYNNVRRIRERFGDKIHIVGGGPHASIRPGELIEVGFDFVIVGEGEKKFTDLLYYLQREKDPSELDGVITEPQKNYPHPKDFKPIDLDTYPPFALKSNIVGPIEVTRGCPFHCKFCSTPFLTGGVVRHRSISNIVEWLKQAVEKSGFERTWFMSPNALCYGGRGRRLELEKLEELLRRTSSIEGLNDIYFGSFPSEVRPEFVTKAALEVLRQYVANSSLQIGIQSGSNRILQEVNRHHTVEEGISAAETALDCGFTPNIDMIFGFPNEASQEQEMSVDLCYDLIEMGASVHAHVFMPLPGSAYEYMLPGKLTDATRKHLGDLARRGLVTGSWGNQEEIAKRLASQFRIDIAKS